MSRLVRSICLLTILLTVFAAVASSTAADPAAGKAAAKELLERYWEKGAPAQASATQQYNAAIKANPGDAFVLHAYWLVLMYQGRYGDSLEKLNEFVKGRETYSQGLRAKAWVHAVRKEYPAAMTTAESLAKSVANNPSPGDKQAIATQARMIAFLGQLAGFLEGPAENSATPDRRSAFESAVLAQLDDAGKKEFAAAKAKVLDEFKRRSGAADVAEEEGLKAAAEDKEKKLAELAEKREAIAKEAEKLAEDQKKLAAELDDKLASLNREDAPLLKRLNELQNTVTTLTDQINANNLAAEQLDQQAGREKNNVQRQKLQNDAQQRRGTATTLQGQVTNIQNTQIAPTIADRAGIEQRRVIARSEAMQKGLVLNDNQKGLQLGALRNKKATKKTENSREGAGGKAVSLESQARAFTTYLPFPFDEVKASLLERLK